ncbi:hypothetical protein RHG00_14450 [Clostridioides difficile]|nr:hypothetical protein [Clostridioides difficile]
MINIYEDISKKGLRGDIYIGVVGPVRTGKINFYKKNLWKSWLYLI